MGREAGGNAEGGRGGGSPGIPICTSQGAKGGGNQDAERSAPTRVSLLSVTLANRSS